MVDDDVNGLSAGLRQEPRTSYVVARLERAIRHEVNKRVKRYGLTTLQYATLSILGSRGSRAGLSNSQLARRAYMTPQSMSEVLQALERKGLVERNPHPNHSRVFPAALTNEGRRVLRACDEVVDGFEREMFADLTPKQEESLRQSLLSAVRALNAGFPEE